MSLMARHNPDARSGRRPRDTPFKVARTMPKTHGRRNAQMCPNSQRRVGHPAADSLQKQALPLRPDAVTICHQGSSAAAILVEPLPLADPLQKQGSLLIHCRSKGCLADPLQKQQGVSCRIVAGARSALQIRCRCGGPACRIVPGARTGLQIRCRCKGSLQIRCRSKRALADRLQKQEVVPVRVQAALQSPSAKQPRCSARIADRCSCSLRCSFVFA